MGIFRAIIDAIQNHPFQSAFLLFAIVWLLGVRAYNILTLEKGYSRIAGLLESVEDLKNGTTAYELYEAKYFASMSAEVYRLPHKGDAKTEQSTCDLGAILSDWKLLPPSDTDPTKPDDNARDQAGWDGPLVYGIWYRPAGIGKLQIALVFRGTHTIGDWWSNVRWFTRYFSSGWDQYDLTRTVTNHVVNNVMIEHPELQELGEPEFIAAGHSLGGGLAQQAGYASEHIKRVYSFNGSSVTGYYDVLNRDKNKMGMRIYRISERGEILALLRSFMKMIFPVLEKNPKIVEATYNFGTRGLVTQHSIDDLACALGNQ
ncbi:Lipase (class 3) [Hoeflea sp. IMCC20628]|uniref:DUF6792 domain-containing protein n=1 Tax=Hoeflea sp. IMCC20628 TaxID=1620421 RepID=UPI00063AA514|nr:DUF6792 domain-containing protein [Hoeflea sp. IMCC20628]AKI00153.1 Lipase (class 3) [Hoeflea sp. IMCC20628]